MSSEPLKHLQSWFDSQTEIYRSTAKSIEIKTMDNPGWELKVTLANTFLAGVVSKECFMQRSEDNWFRYRSDGAIFHAYGGSENLADLLYGFLKWSKSWEQSASDDQSFTPVRSDQQVFLLQEWFASRCDGDWEHGGGPVIASTPEGGWELRLKLMETDLEGSVLIQKFENQVRSEVIEGEYVSICPNFRLNEMIDGLLLWCRGHALNLKVRIGDMFMLKTRRGLHTVQATHFHPNDGGLSLLKVYDLQDCEDPSQFFLLGELPPRFSCFCPIQIAVNSGDVIVVGNTPVPDKMKPFPIFRLGYSLDIGSRITNWWLWDGIKESRIGKLTDDQRRLPIKEIISFELLLQRIESGWTPEQDAR